MGEVEAQNHPFFAVYSIIYDDPLTMFRYKVYSIIIALLENKAR